MPQRYFEAFVLQNFLNGDQLPGLRHSRLKYNSKRAISDNPLGRVADCLALENIHYELKAIMQMRSPARTTATHVCRCLAWHQVRAFLVVHLVVNSNGWDYWLDTSQSIVNFENGSTVVVNSAHGAQTLGMYRFLGKSAPILACCSLFMLLNSTPLVSNAPRVLETLDSLSLSDQ